MEAWISESFPNWIALTQEGGHQEGVVRVKCPRLQRAGSSLWGVALPWHSPPPQLRRGRGQAEQGGASFLRLRNRSLTPEVLDLWLLWCSAAEHLGCGAGEVSTCPGPTSGAREEPGPCFWSPRHPPAHGLRGGARLTLPQRL